MRTQSTLLVLTAALALLTGSTCNEHAGDQSSEEPPEAPVEDDASQRDGFTFALREGSQVTLTAATPVIAASPLDEAATAALLARFASIASAEGDAAPFAFRERSVPAPRTGATRIAPFPPPPSPEPPPTFGDAPPALLRYQPEGEVPVAPRISLTFSRPMVPVTSHETLATADVPVRVSPPIAGVWRWVGTRTLFFDPEGRAPMATDFTVEVPAEMSDAEGRPLGKASRWSFHTPAPSIVESYPGGRSVPLDPIIRIVFDQRVDAAAILSRVKLEVDAVAVPIDPLKFVELNELI